MSSSFIAVFEPNNSNVQNVNEIDFDLSPKKTRSHVSLPLIFLILEIVEF